MLELLQTMPVDQLPQAGTSWPFVGKNADAEAWALGGTLTAIYAIKSWAVLKAKGKL